MRIVWVIYCCLYLPLSESLRSQVITERKEDTLTGEEIQARNDYCATLKSTVSCNIEEGIYFTKLKYPFPNPEVKNLKINMSIRNSLVPNPLKPYSDYEDFQFIDNLDGTFNITVPIKMENLIPTQCAFDETFDSIYGFMVIEYTCIIEIMFIPTEPSLNQLLPLHLYYILITINAQDHSQLSFLAYPKVTELCPPATCLMDSTIETQTRLCMPNDCSKENNSTVLIMGDPFQFVIEIVDEGLSEAFDLSILQILYKYSNEAVPMTEECKKWCKVGDLPCKGDIVIECYTVTTGNMTLDILTKITPARNPGRVLEVVEEDKQYRVFKSQKMLRVCAKEDQICINQYLPPDPYIIINPTQDEDEGDSKYIIIYLSVTIVILVCVIFGLLLYICCNKLRKYKNPATVDISQSDSKDSV